MAAIEVRAYTAGLIDGEGCIRMQKNYGLTLCVGNTSLDMLEWLRDHWGGKIHVNRHSYPNSKPFFQWQTHGKEAILVISEIVPFMVVKVKQAQKALELAPFIGMKDNYHPERQAFFRGKRQEIYLALKTLNKRGIADA